MSPIAVIITLLAYLLMLFGISFWVGRNADNEGFFIGNRRTSWWMATLAMIGAAMSGVTFISVPGSVVTDGMTYMQMVIGFTLGQMIVAFVLIPLFYRLGVVSLYEYLDRRFGVSAHKTGAWCFLVAKLIGSSLKVFVVCAVLQFLVFDAMNIPFWVNAVCTMLLVWLYTFSGGVRALIPTDVIQSLLLVGSVVVTIFLLSRAMELGSVSQIYEAVSTSRYSHIWEMGDAASPRYFWKMVAGGMLSLVAMTGLDQDMMQRNMSCRTVRDSQINILLTALCQIGVILLLLTLGVLLYLYIEYAALPMPLRGDDAFAAVVAYGGLPKFVGVVFVLGLISSTYSAAGSALTSLTTSFTLDIMRGAQHKDERHLTLLRKRIHLVMAIVMALLILVFRAVADDSVINLVFKIAGYTYGPILGLFTFGILSRRQLKGRFVPFVAMSAPALSYLLQWAMATYCNYYIGFELLGYNALITIVGLMAISRTTKDN